MRVLPSRDSKGRFLPMNGRRRRRNRKKYLKGSGVATDKIIDNVAKRATDRFGNAAIETVDNYGGPVEP